MPRKIVRSRTGDLFTRKKLSRTKSLRELNETRPAAEARTVDAATTTATSASTTVSAAGAAVEPKIYKSQLMVKFSKPSFSIYLDYVPRDKCFKVAYIVEGEPAAGADGAAREGEGGGGGEVGVEVRAQVCYCATQMSGRHVVSVCSAGQQAGHGWRLCRRTAGLRRDDAGGAGCRQRWLLLAVVNEVINATRTFA